MIRLIFFHKCEDSYKPTIFTNIENITYQHYYSVLGILLPSGHYNIVLHHKLSEGMSKHMTSLDIDV